jgi:hypothetical protein
LTRTWALDHLRGHVRSSALAQRQHALLRDFVGYDGEQGVARISQTQGRGEWRWSVYLIVPGRPGVTSGYETDPKEARRKVETAWAIAKAHERPVRTATAVHLKVEPWPGP